jgi:hypothetical protein
VNPVPIGGGATTLTVAVAHATYMANQNLTVQLEAMPPTPLVAGCTTVVANAATTTQAVKVPSGRTAAGTVSANFSVTPGSVGSNSCPGTITYKATVLPATNVAILAPTSDQAGLSIQPSVQIVTSDFATPFVGVGKSSTLQVSVRASAGLASPVSVGLAPVGASSGQCFNTTTTSPQTLPQSTATSQTIPLPFGVQATSNGQEVEVGCGGTVNYRASFGTLPSGVMSLPAQDDTAMLTVLGLPKVDGVDKGEMQSAATYTIEDEYGQVLSEGPRDVPLGIVNKLNGNVQTLTITGKDLWGAQVSVANLKMDESLPDRVLPQVRVMGASSNTQLQVEVNASDAGVFGFYTLAIRTDGGESDFEFRVLPAGAVVESYTPHHVIAGNSYILTIEGENLSTGTVQLAPDALAQNLKLINLQVDTQRQTLTGLLIVGTGGTYVLGLNVHLLIGTVELPIWVYPPPDPGTPGNGDGTDCLLVIDDGGSHGDETEVCSQRMVPGMPVYYQAPRLTKSKEDLAAEARIASRQFFGGVCRFRRKFEAKRFQMALGVCVTGQGASAEYNPDTSQCWNGNGAKTGAVEVKVIVLSLFFQVELEVAWGWEWPWVCAPATWPVYCLRGYAGAEVVGGRGIVYSISSCQGVGVGRWFAQGGGVVQNPLITVQGNGSGCFSVAPNETTKDLAPENPGVIGLKFTNNCCNNESVDVRFNTSGARTFQTVTFDWLSNIWNYPSGFILPGITSTKLGTISTVPDPENPVCWDPKLEITTPGPTTILNMTHSLGYYPTMPEIPGVSAKVTGVPDEVARNTRFKWRAIVQYYTKQSSSRETLVFWEPTTDGAQFPKDFLKLNQGTIIGGGYPNTTYVRSGDYSIDVAGGKVFFEVSATVNGTTLTKIEEGPTILAADNPPRENIQSLIDAYSNSDTEVATWLKKMSCHESTGPSSCTGTAPKGQRQFVMQDETSNSCCSNLRQCPGEPVSASNGDGGFGATQITTTNRLRDGAGPAQLWDWRANVAEGYWTFDLDKKPVAEAYPRQVQYAYPQSLIDRTNAWRRSQNLLELYVVYVPDYSTPEFRVYPVREPDLNGQRIMRDLLVEDTVRGFNGYPQGGQFGLRWHEFRLYTRRVDIPGVGTNQEILEVENEGPDLDPTKVIAYAIWERVPANSRPNVGNRKYVNDVREMNPSDCSKLSTSAASTPAKNSTGVIERPTSNLQVPSIEREQMQNKLGSANHSRKD